MVRLWGPPLQTRCLAVGARYAVVPVDANHSSRWIGFGWAPNVGKLYAAPSNAVGPPSPNLPSLSLPPTPLHLTPLIVDPVTLTTDVVTLVTGPIGNAWSGMAFAFGKLWAAPYNADAVLIVDPLRNTTDQTTIAGFGAPSVCSRRTDGSGVRSCSAPRPTGCTPAPTLRPPC